ncbi:MAG: hypothetical protein E6040_10880 [Lachnospiraceae bacterium]|nr:hypothetical protein [Lachnospiraceae bacterium]
MSIKTEKSPVQVGTFQILGNPNYYNVDLYWPNKKVMIFSAESEEEFNKASKSEWKCFCLSGEGTIADRILEVLKEI